MSVPPEDWDVVSHEGVEARHLNQASAVWWADHLTHSLGVTDVAIVPHTIDALECPKCVAMVEDYARSSKRRAA